MEAEEKLSYKQLISFSRQFFSTNLLLPYKVALKKMLVTGVFIGAYDCIENAWTWLE